MLIKDGSSPGKLKNTGQYLAIRNPCLKTAGRQEVLLYEPRVKTAVLDIDRLTVDWNDSWAATNYNIQWSADGTNFTDVTVRSNVVYYSTAAPAT